MKQDRRGGEGENAASLKGCIDPVRFPGWVSAVHRMGERMPEAVLVGGLGLAVQLAGRRPDLAKRLFELRAEGPWDVDVVCPRGLFEKVRDKTPPGFRRKKAELPPSYYLAFSDTEAAPGGLHVDVILEGPGHPLGRDRVEVNGKTVYAANPEELFLQRMFMLLGYEAPAGKPKKPGPKHFAYFGLNRGIVDEKLLETLFPLFRERMALQRNVRVAEESWRQMMENAGTAGRRTMQ
jgi:hypothetical protein